MNNIITGPVDDQHWTGIGDNPRKWVHVQHIGHIATPQLHGTAVEPLRDIVRIKSSEHHFPGAGIVWDAESRVKQHQLRNLLFSFGGGQCRDETTLAAAYQDHTFITVNIRELKDLIDHRLQVHHLC